MPLAFAGSALFRRSARARTVPSPEGVRHSLLLLSALPVTGLAALFLPCQASAVSAIPIRATLSDLLNGNAALSPEMALRIEKAFDVSMDMLLRMQAWHDASQMRARAN